MLRKRQKTFSVANTTAGGMWRGGVRSYPPSLPQVWSGGDYPTMEAALARAQAEAAAIGYTGTVPVSGWFPLGNFGPKGDAFSAVWQLTGSPAYRVDTQTT